MNMLEAHVGEEQLIHKLTPKMLAISHLFNESNIALTRECVIVTINQSAEQIPEIVLNQLNVILGNEN